MVATSKVQIDQERCIGCGSCVEDCVAHTLGLENDKAVVQNDKCLECGHCIAVCPQEAVSLAGYDMSEVIPYEPGKFGLDAEILLNTIKFRRSVRHFSTRQVEKEVLEKIIEAGRFTPTGSNRQNVRYIVVEKDIPVLHAAAAETFRTVYHQENVPEGFFFHGAPVLILAISEGELNGALASMSMELMAEALGLGTLYVGLFARPANQDPALRSLLGLEENENIVTCLAMGYPEVQYLRTVPRKKAGVSWR